MFFNIVRKYIFCVKNIFIDRFAYKYILCIFLYTLSLNYLSSLYAKESPLLEDNIKLFMNDPSTKRTFIKYWLEYLTSERKDANAYFKLFKVEHKKTGNCLGFVIFIENSVSDIILIPAIKKESSDNGIIATDLLNIVSSYTGYDTFLVLDSFFDNKAFSSYSNHNNYLQKQSRSSLYTKVKSKEIDIQDYRITNLEDDIPLFLQISLSILTGANPDMKSSLHHIQSFGLLNLDHIPTLAEKISLYKNYNLNHNVLIPSILDYIEAALLLSESESDIQDPTSKKESLIDSTSSTEDELSENISPISRFYVDLLTYTNISSSSVYKMFKKKFFNADTVIKRLFNFSDPSLGIEILDQILSNLSYKDMVSFTNSMIILDGISILFYIIDKKTSYIIDSRYSNVLLLKLYSKPKFEIDITQAEKLLSAYHEDISQRLYSTLPAKKSILRNIMLNSDSTSIIAIRTLLNIYANIPYKLTIVDIDLLTSFIDTMIERDNSDFSASDILFIVLKLDNITNEKIKVLGKSGFQEVRDLLIKISNLKSKLLRTDPSSDCSKFFIP